MATATVWCWLVKIKSNVRLQKSATNQLVVLLLDLFSIASSGGKAFKPHFPSRCVELVRFSPQVPHVPGRSGLAEQVRPDSFGVGNCGFPSTRCDPPQQRAICTLRQAREAWIYCPSSE